MLAQQQPSDAGGRLPVPGGTRRRGRNGTHLPPHRHKRCPLPPSVEAIPEQVLTGIGSCPGARPNHARLAAGGAAPFCARCAAVRGDCRSTGVRLACRTLHRRFTVRAPASHSFPPRITLWEVCAVAAASARRLVSDSRLVRRRSAAYSVCNGERTSVGMPVSNGASGCE